MSRARSITLRRSSALHLDFQGAIALHLYGLDCILSRRVTGAEAKIRVELQL